MDAHGFDDKPPTTAQGDLATPPSTRPADRAAAVVCLALGARPQRALAKAAVHGELPGAPRQQCRPRLLD